MLSKHNSNLRIIFRSYINLENLLPKKQNSLNKQAIRLQCISKSPRVVLLKRVWPLVEADNVGASGGR